MWIALKISAPCAMLLTVLQIMTVFLDAVGAAEEGDYAVGVVRVEFSPATEAPALDSLAILRAAGVRTELVEAYQEKENIAGSITNAALLARSSEEAPGRWCDIVVPFSTEKFWVETLRDIPGVISAQRRPAHAVRGSQNGEDLPVSQERINRLEGPTLQFVLRRQVAATAIERMHEFCRGYYGTSEPAELHPLGESEVRPRVRFFAFDRLRKKLFDEPPWQRVRISARLDPAVEEQQKLKLTFTGGGAYGPSFSPPPDTNYENLLADEVVEARFREHVQRLGTLLRTRFQELGMLTE